MYGSSASDERELKWATAGPMNDFIIPSIGMEFSRQLNFLIKYAKWLCIFFGNYIHRARAFNRLFLARKMYKFRDIFLDMSVGKRSV